MPISLTCSCGARLEIDDKFAGQTIPCPDCNKRLVAEPPAPPPTRTSELAVLSLLLALVGAFTVVGSLAAIVCGAVAHRQLTRKRSTVGGVRLAQAGMILGGVFMAVTILALSSRSLFGLDGLLRRHIWADKLEYPGQVAVSTSGRFGDRYSLDRPSPLSAWGVLRAQEIRRDGDHAMLVNVRDDAHILWLSDRVTRDDDESSKRARARERFCASELVRLIGRLPENASEVAKERGVSDNGLEFFVDIPVGGIARTFFFRLEQQGGPEGYINVLICGARAHRFAGLLDVFRQVTLKQEGGR